jgi:hypothetical protein
MGRSQRHMVVEQGAPANGEAGAQGEVAPTYVAQIKSEGVPPERELPALDEVAGELVVPGGPPGGPLQGSSMAGAIPEWYDDGTTPPEPEDNFRLVSLNPNEAPAGGPEFSIAARGFGFEDGAVIMFDNIDQQTEFVDATTLRCMSGSSTAAIGSVQVTVRNPGGEVTPDSVLLSYIETPVRSRDAGTEERQMGPFTILRIEDHEDGIQIELSDAGNLREGGVVLIEATGNTNINGSYEIWSIDGNAIIVNNDYELSAPIEGKGRLTIT